MQALNRVYKSYCDETLDRRLNVASGRYRSWFCNDSPLLRQAVVLLACVFGLRNSAQAISQNAQDSSLQTLKWADCCEGTHLARVGRSAWCAHRAKSFKGHTGGKR
jgi:hypothetical protein